MRSLVEAALREFGNIALGSWGSSRGEGPFEIKIGPSCVVVVNRNSGSFTLDLVEIPQHILPREPMVEHLEEHFGVFG